MQGAKRSETHRGLRRWVEASHEASERTRLLTKFVAGLLRASLLKGFNTWSSTASTLASSYDRLRVALKAKTLMAMRTWVEAADEMRTARSILSTMMKKDKAI